MPGKWILSALAVTVIASASHAAAASKVYVGGRDTSGHSVPLGQIDHGTWNGLLGKYVDRDGLVDYAAWKRSPVDLAALDAYLNTLGRGNPSAETSPEGRLAFWINAYNALTLRGILREYPTTSIRNHTAKLFGYNIWKDLLLWVHGEAYSLDAMEHDVLRKLGEPRIHFAIVCASVGCPRLLDRAYTPANLEAQLAENSRDFFSRPRNFRIDRTGKTVYASSILKWFKSDFGPSAERGLAALAGYLPEDDARRFIEKGRFAVRYLDYDWNLNAQ